MRMITASAVLPLYPATTPMINPRKAPISTATNPTCSEIRAPQITLDRTQRPILSVPAR